MFFVVLSKWPLHKSNIALKDVLMVNKENTVWQEFGCHNGGCTGCRWISNYFLWRKKLIMVNGINLSWHFFLFFSFFLSAEFSAHLRPVARSVEIKDPPAPLFFHGGRRSMSPTGKWLRTTLVWTDVSNVEKCIKLYTLPFPQILRKMCHCQLLRNTFTRKV